MVSGYIENKWRAISPAAKAAFFSALIVGFITHAVGITNYFLSHDGLLHMFAQGAGRNTKQFEALVTGALGGDISVPSTYYTMNIVFIAIGAGITASYLKIHSKVIAIITGMLMVTFPTVVSMNAYLLLSLTRFFSFLMASLSVFFSERGKKGAVLSVLFLTVSLGTYQAFIGWTAGLFVLQLILCCFRRTYDVPGMIKCGIKYVLILAASILLYVVTLKIWQKIYNVQFPVYMGMDQIGRVDLKGIPGLIVSAYKKVVDFFLFDSYGEGTATTKWVYRAIVICTFILYCFLFVKTKLYKNTMLALISIVLVGLFPLAIHSIAVLSQYPNTHWMMIYPFIQVPIMLLAFADISEGITNPAENGSFSRALSLVLSGVLLLGAVQSWIWFMTTGECYTAMRLNNSAAYATSVQLCSKLYDEGYTKTMPLALVGDQSTPFDLPDNKMYSKSQYAGMIGPQFNWDPGHLYIYLQYIIGLNYTRATADQIEAVCQSREVGMMPVYPEEGSVKIVDGVMVVKMSEVISTLVKEIDEEALSEKSMTTVYGGEDFDLMISAGENDAYAGENVFTFTEPDEQYILKCDNVERTSGDVESIKLTIYSWDTKTSLTERYVQVGEGFSWSFMTSSLVSEDSSKKSDLIIYAGEPGYTANNTVVLQGLRLEKAED